MTFVDLSKPEPLLSDREACPLMPRINDKPLRVTEYIELFRWIKAGSRHPLSNFVLAQEHIRIVPVGSLGIISIHLDQRDPAARFYVTGKCLQISLTVFNVMKYVMKQS